MTDKTYATGFFLGLLAAPTLVPFLATPILGAVLGVFLDEMLPHWLALPLGLLAASAGLLWLNIRTDGFRIARWIYGLWLVLAVVMVPMEIMEAWSEDPAPAATTPAK